MWYYFKVCGLSVKKLVTSVGEMSALEVAINGLKIEIFNNEAVGFVISQVFTVHFHCALTACFHQPSVGLFPESLSASQGLNSAL